MTALLYGLSAHKASRANIYGKLGDDTESTKDVTGDWAVWNVNGRNNAVEKTASGISDAARDSFWGDFSRNYLGDKTRALLPLKQYHSALLPASSLVLLPAS